ncbi:MAG: DEAD/DEAH box helicase [Candidatus Marsarchaeota archaeon]|nr:DEAD/DEAH box helicase [Candidatus Marsarchaeota archaeon]
MKDFSEIGLKPHIVEALNKINFVKATDVQERAIPIALQGKDIIVKAKTGTGKTLAFLLPILQDNTKSNTPVALIVVPTRELAIQIAEVANKLVSDRQKVTVVYGASSINQQIQNLRRNPSIIVGTPGRLLDLIDRGDLILDNIRFLVLDEADTMLDMGFVDDIEEIMSITPESRQTMLFSATMPNKILDVAKDYMKDSTYIKVGDDEGIAAIKIKHYYAICDNRMKFATLISYIKTYNPSKAIIFAHTKYAADEIYAALRNQGIESVLMHGGLTQAKRESSIFSFKRKARFLIATNVAARGLDISGISDIINFDVPDDPVIYVHRVGRTARMDAHGRAFTIVGRNQSGFLDDIEYAARIKMEHINLDIEPYKNIRLFGRREESHSGRFNDRRPNRGFDNREHQNRRRFEGNNRNNRHGSYR